MTKNGNDQTPRFAPRNPKRHGTEHPIHINWFPYYAGYNSGFVFDSLKSLAVEMGDSILDPWNGSGTTTTTAYRMGATTIGCDINPVMVIAAKSALLDPGTAPSLLPLSEELLNVARTISLNLKDDPLSEWYSPSSAYHIRRIHHAIWKVLVDSDSMPTCRADHISGLSTLAAFFITALFRVTRSFLSPFLGSNPTWIRSPKTPQNRVRPSEQIVFHRFQKEIRAMSLRLSDAFNRGLKKPIHGSGPTITVASSQSLPVKNSSIKAVVTSPPYLTRIDYAVATKPELATLEMSLSKDFAKLRKSMLGAPAIRAASPPPQAYGESCERFMEAVANHPSKGSINYYHKLFNQYFSDMHKSLGEISRVLVKNGNCVLVVQDSYYKEIHADLAQFVTDIAEIHGLTLMGRNDFEWNRNMVRVNSRSRRYRTSDIAVESALWFSKL